MLAFFAIHLNVDALRNAFAPISAKAVANNSFFKDADNADQVPASLREQLHGLARPRAIGVLHQTAPADAAAQLLRVQADRRLIVLGAPTQNRRLTAEKSPPIQLAWLPAAANARLSAMRPHIYCVGLAVPAAPAEADLTARLVYYHR